MRLREGTGGAAPDVSLPNPSVAAEKPFLDENAAAMDWTMAGMEATPTDDVAEAARP